MQPNDWPLFVVAYSKRLKDRRTGRYFWRPMPVIYTKAPDAATAKKAAIASERGMVNVIAVGPAIGYHVESDRGGKIVLAT